MNENEEFIKKSIGDVILLDEIQNDKFVENDIYHGTLKSDTLIPSESNVSEVMNDWPTKPDQLLAFSSFIIL